MALEEDFGYEVDKTTKKIKGKTSQRLSVKLLKPIKKLGIKLKKKQHQDNALISMGLRRQMDEGGGSE